MNLHITTILFILLDHINKVLTQGIPLSPCPKMFQYRFDGQEWFGLVSVRNTDVGEPLHLRITLSMRGKPRTNYLGEIELLTRGQFQSDTPVLYKVKFPKHQIPPKLQQITTNNEIVCLGSNDVGIFVTQIQLEHTRKFTFLPAASGSGGAGDGNFEDAALLPKHRPLDTIDSNPMRSTKDICGKVDGRIRFQVLHALKSDGISEGDADDYLQSGDDDMVRAGASSLPLVTTNDPSAQASASVDGLAGAIDELPSITRGAWPWLAAIYVNNLTSLAYQCSGTLISSRVVVSSAHCFHMFKKRYTANEVLVFLGRHNLKNWNEEGSLAAPCDDIFIHPDFDEHLNSYDADVAVLVLKHEVRFNTFIRPACIWSGSTKAEYIEGEHGIVVSWRLGAGNGNGSTLAAQPTAVPKVIDAPIVSNEDCFKANNKFRSLSSNRTFCAGVVITQTTNTSKTATTTTTKTSTVQPKKAAASDGKALSGPCTGDSGAGLMILKNNRWMLRGTVSASLPIIESVDDKSSSSATAGLGGAQISRCSENQYVIYTDVAQFLDWIMSFTI